MCVWKIAGKFKVDKEEAEEKCLIDNFTRIIVIEFVVFVVFFTAKCRRSK